MQGCFAGTLTELEFGNKYSFAYSSGYQGLPISLTMPVQVEAYHFDRFPPFFDGLLPEGTQLDGLLRYSKIDRNDYFQQLIATGHDLVGAVTVEEIL